MCGYKYFHDSWREHYWRNHNAQKFMTKERFNYKMAPIRYFKEVVKCLDSYNNFVFAADFKGLFTIFLLNEKDIENDDDTLVS
jgi:hypothetical protein